MILRERMKDGKQLHPVGRSVGLIYVKKFIPVVKNGENIRSQSSRKSH